MSEIEYPRLAVYRQSLDNNRLEMALNVPYHSSSEQDYEESIRDFVKNNIRLGILQPGPLVVQYSTSMTDYELFIFNANIIVR